MEINVENLSVNYGNKKVIEDINFKINSGEMVSIIGPNGSGKSTLIKAVSRCLKIETGKIYIDSLCIEKMKTKELSKILAVLPQAKHTPSDTTVEELVSYGRFPHLKFCEKLKKSDREIISWALEKTGLYEHKNRLATSLSGGEKQRVWIAMSLAQKPKILILDEPTTYLDISYQLELLELIKNLNETLGLTVIMVLHDLNYAARYSDKIMVLKNGKLWDWGGPKEILSKKMLKEIFRIDGDIHIDKVNNCPYFIPNSVSQT